MIAEEQLVQDTEKLDRDKLLQRLRQLLTRLPDSERLQLIDDVFEGYCRHCGTPDPRCQCWNDE